MSSVVTNPITPPFTRETATSKVRAAEDAWNTRDPERVSLAYSIDSRWRNRSEFINGREEIVAFLTRKWARELEYRLIKELWTFGDARIAASLGPDLDDEPRLPRRLAEDMFAQALTHGLREVAVAGHEVGEGGEGLRAARLIELAQALDDRFFRREVAVEIARAHANFVGDTLHRRRMEAVANEGALGGFEDSKASLGFGSSTSHRNGSYRHVTAHENERSFSKSAANVASEWR